MASTIENRTPLRRRSSSADPLKKVTLRLHTKVTEAVRAAVNDGAAPSTDVFVEQAVVAALQERRRERLYQAYADAAHDPAFVADMNDTSGAFDAAVSDGLKSSR